MKPPTTRSSTRAWSRRRFLQTSVASGAALATSRATYAHAWLEQDVATAARPLEVLLLGGTGFLGPHTIDFARARGHRVTLFNRGRTNSDLYTDLEKLRGDRDPDVDEGLRALEREIERGRRWDVVIDTSGYYPRLVRASAERLAGAVQQYIFVSSISVYGDLSVPGMDESAPVGVLEDESVESMGPNFEYYGPLKALCESAVEEAMPGRVASMRAGLLVGPRDDSDRFTYWPVRIARGGRVLAPGDPDERIQFIDARDLGRFMVHCAEERTTGVFNATGPVHPMTMAEMLYGCKAVTGGDASFTWVDATFLQEHGVQPWTHMPAWAPSTGALAGLMHVDCARAIAAGLQTRPLAGTVRDLLTWFRTLPAERQAMLGPEALQRTPANADDTTVTTRLAGISSERERAVLAAWASR